MGVTADPNVPHAVGPPDELPAGQAETYLVLPESERSDGFVRPLRMSYLHKECGEMTTMHADIAATFARNPAFYDSTFCIFCEKHRPLVEFVWLDLAGHVTGDVVGS